MELCCLLCLGVSCVHCVGFSLFPCRARRYLARMAPSIGSTTYSRLAEHGFLNYKNLLLTHTHAAAAAAHGAFDPNVCATTKKQSMANHM